MEAAVFRIMFAADCTDRKCQPQRKHHLTVCAVQMKINIYRSTKYCYTVCLLT